MSEQAQFDRGWRRAIFDRCNGKPYSDDYDDDEGDGYLQGWHSLNDVSATDHSRLFNAGGYVGIALIQGATLPALIGYLIGQTHNLPPLSMTLLVWAGLTLFLARSIYARQRLYIISEGIGFALQAIMFVVTILSHY